MTEQLGSIRARLENIVNISLSLTNGLAAFIATNPRLDESQFAAYARAVLEREPVQVIEGGYTLAPGVCPWWDTVRGQL